MSLEKQVFVQGIEETDTEQREEMGVRRQVDDGTSGELTYRYVKYESGTGAVASVEGNLVYWVAAGNWDVTSDLSDSSRNLVAGVLVSTPADEEYCWIQTGGIASVNTNGDDDIAAGDAVIAANADGTADSVAAGTAPTHKVVGWAEAADSDANNTVSVMLELE